MKVPASHRLSELETKLMHALQQMTERVDGLARLQEAIEYARQAVAKRKAHLSQGGVK